MHACDNEKQHDRIMDRVYKINGQVAKNSEHRITWKAKIEVWKYHIGLLGISNVANLTYMWLTNFQH